LNLRYFADPLCSWCYGFGPELAKLMAARPDLKVAMVMGGLRPFNREPMSPAFRDMLREHWHHVSTASGLPFSREILERDDFAYDTEPACRAVVTARQLFPAQALPMLESIQAALYRDGRDATQAAELADIAAENGYDRATFLASMESDGMRAATRADFAATQSLGVSGFPTVAASRGEELYLVTSGYVTHDVLESRLAEIERLTLK
jgi:putative protein-disulfide isomerase